MTLTHLDRLSPATRQILLVRPDAYRRLVVPADAGADKSVTAGLGQITPGNVLSVPVIDAEEAAALVSGLWLWHDGLHRSHELSQAIDTPTGSFWHAIMHRREGDFNNAKYWYGKCRNHPSMEQMARRGTALVAESAVSEQARAVVERGWDPYALVDFIESFYDAAEDHPPMKLAQDMQCLEWEILFDHTIQAATER